MPISSPLCSPHHLGATGIPHIPTPSSHRGSVPLRATSWGGAPGGWPGFGVLPAGQGSPLTVGLPGGAAAAQPHDDGSVGQLALHAVLADAVQDVGREMDVQVAQEHDAVLVLGGAGRSERNSPGERSHGPELVPVPAHLHHVHAGLEPGRALEIPRAPQVLEPGREDRAGSAGDRQGHSQEGDRNHRRGERAFSGRPRCYSSS